MLDKQKCGLLSQNCSLLKLPHPPFRGMFLEATHHPSTYHISQSYSKDMPIWKGDREIQTLDSVHFFS